MFAQVAIARKLSDHQDILTYMVPDTLIPTIGVGSMVTVPMGRGNQTVHGYVVGLFSDEQSVETLRTSYNTKSFKSILSVSESDTLLTEELVALALWMSRYYVCPCYYVLEYMLPKFARSKKQDVVIWNGDSDLTETQLLFLESDVQQLAVLIRTEQQLPLKKLYKQYPNAEPLLAQLESLQLIQRQSVYEQQGSIKENYVYESCITPEQLEEAKAKLGRAVKQWELLRFLTYQGASDGKVLRSYWQGYASLVKELEKKQLVRRRRVQVQRYNTDQKIFRNERKLELNEEQKRALTEILRKADAPTSECVLLHGVTGSGKTEVYLRTLQHVLEQGQGAIVLVPEIALTPQLIGRFRAVLGEYVEVLHSNMSDGERFDAWQRLHAGQTRIVVGVRSAVFAPVQNLKLIIMDEEHETTFKQSEPDPRYHARDVARYRMEYNDGLLLLGSATPSVTTYYHAVQQGGTLLTMEHRALQQPLPEVEIINMAREFQSGNRSMFSQRLAQTMEESLQRGEQVILFLNRRGFSSSIVCRECGHTLTCEKCSIALTYHKEQGLAKCHYCDYMEPVPSACPSCGSRFIRYMGSGTELVEEEVKKRWPWVVTDRMDLDTTQTKGAHQTILERFARGEAQVLIGTQMVAKGLDFPNVTTVGVMAADLILNLPDYTAAERTFQLLTQVSGRAGRGDKPGQVVIQTYNPEHYSLLAAKEHDYIQFYQKEILMRQLMEYPPFSYMVRILVSDFSADGLFELLMTAAEAISKQYPQLELLGPAEAPIAMVRKRYRFHLILKGKSLDIVREAAEYGQKVMNLSRKSKTLRILLDVEPSSVL